MIEAQQKMSLEYGNTLVDLPAGRRSATLRKVPRGDVLRCYIEDDEAGELIVHVDNQTLNLWDFGRLLRTFAGWGMRISFVPEDRIADQPDIVIGEPGNGEA